MKKVLNLESEKVGKLFHRFARRYYVARDRAAKYEEAKRNTGKEIKSLFSENHWEALSVRAFGLQADYVQGGKRTSAEKLIAALRDKVPGDVLSAAIAVSESWVEDSIRVKAYID